MKRTIQATYENDESRFYGIGGGIATGVFLGSVVHAFVTQKVLAKFIINLDIVGRWTGFSARLAIRIRRGDYHPLGASRDAHSNARIIAATDQDLYADGFNQALLRRCPTARTWYCRSNW